MRGLVRLAAMKQTVGMLPICEDMITKVHLCLDLFLIYEALLFMVLLLADTTLFFTGRPVLF